jgi:hypothetical protein
VQTATSDPSVSPTGASTPLPPVDPPGPGGAATATAVAVGVGTWLRFLVGRADAIVRVAGCRRGLLVGLLFVLSAGFAREYDHEDLLREPWHLLIPAVASVGLSFVLYAAFWPGVAGPHRPPFAAGYQAFLTAFWMTAPMAWLYAVPYERLLGAADSVRANLWTLALVAGWRVVLMSRVIAVLTGRPYAAALVVVLAVSDVAVQAALWGVPLPLLSIMGGVQLAEADLILANLTFLVRTFGFLALFALVPTAIGTLVVLRRNVVPPRVPTPTGTTRPLALLAVASVLAWAAFLPFTQPEQRRRWEVESDLRAGRVERAVEAMSALPREAFPPHWDPPPRVGYPDERPPLLDVMEVLADGRGSSWVRATYVDKFVRGHVRPWQRMRWAPEEEKARIRSILDRLPEGPAIRREHEWSNDPDGLAPTTAATAPTTTAPTTTAAPTK